MAIKKPYKERATATIDSDLLERARKLGIPRSGAFQEGLLAAVLAREEQLRTEEATP